MKNRQIHIFGGGTVSHVSSHLALTAPAYGQTATDIWELCHKEFNPQSVDGSQGVNTIDVVQHLTKMAGGDELETHEDVSKRLDEVIADPLTKIIFFNVALVDFEGFLMQIDPATRKQTPQGRGKYAFRANSDGFYTINLLPLPKLVSKIRKTRKDIFLVAFKTTCGATEDEQYLAGLNLLKKSSCNLVLANDVKTRLNMIITPEEARYHVSSDRAMVLEKLVHMTKMRSHLTFTRSTVVAGDPIPWASELVPQTLRAVVDHCIKEGAYKPFRGATVGHFAAKLDDTTFLTSRRKTNFNDLDKLGLVKIKTDGPDSVVAYGSKPSVGGQSQRIVFHDHQEYDCIAHFHCPIKSGSLVPTVSQEEFECGSHECGKNTSNGLKKFTIGESTFSAVYLDQHGPNIVFHRNARPEDITKFIDENFDLKGKTGGLV